ncbi:3-carboxy-cis,cis-muconate cycloisomerase [Nitratireductor mangrovi]|uniref:3-carboxy-cis,cis-muconate cycloisomerase n=1 Tax=Nitratireductor mangrovi TaxID=2599600 RepID=A0A5B8KV39_9HYPH|nr:3-carboxy-cis,cis-muconate cycloisomerase [Nitratireductor mangrovi]QDY99369.1 3-carboxy-cis,cis-muconate cycloisomerase [Nitratireductor mangrovi]
MSVSPFEHPFLSGLVGDPEIAAEFAVDAEIVAMLGFEAALAEAEAAEGVIPAGAGQEIASRIKAFEPDLEGLREGVARDGVVVPTLVSQLRSEVGEALAGHVHFGATSQDVIDTSLSMRLSRVLDVLGARIDALAGLLATLSERYGDIEVMAHTRMQAAIPVTAARKIRSWRDPLLRHKSRLAGVRESVAVLHFGGAAGTLDRLGGKGQAVGRRMAIALGLTAVADARHSERDGMADLASWLSLVTGSLGKMGQDIALAAQSEVGEVKLASGGGSSAMPHKVNPVGAETLVTLARFNATLVAGMHQAMVHENERSGAAWTLEWMLLPQMAVACGAALGTASRLVDAISFPGKDDA